MLNCRPSGKPPPVSFKIPRAILTLSVGLIDRLRIDERSSLTSPFVVRVDIIDVHKEARSRHISRKR